jgi:hypothetical protein
MEEHLRRPLVNSALMRKLNSFFESTVDIPRLKHGNKQTVETLIKKALPFAKYLRNEKPTWQPRIVTLS